MELLPAMFKVNVNIAVPTRPFLPARDVRGHRIRRAAWVSTAMKLARVVGFPIKDLVVILIARGLRHSGTAIGRHHAGSGSESRRRLIKSSNSVTLLSLKSLTSKPWAIAFLYFIMSVRYR